MTSMMLGSSSHAAIADPNAVRNIRAPHVIASDRSECATMIAPTRHGYEMRPMSEDD
jgi:hypothetical protein